MSIASALASRDRADYGVEQLTSVDTGVSGVTPTSPALSVADVRAVVAFTVYERGRPQLVVLDASTASARRRPYRRRRRSASDHGRRCSSVDAAGLVDRVGPISRPACPISSSWSSASTRRDCRSRTIGQPYLSSGGGPFGTFVRGGGALMFGDMLGERRLGAAVQIGNRLRDAAFEFRFLNQERRWNWGAVGELEPGLRRYRRNEAIEHDGEPALLQTGRLPAAHAAARRRRCSRIRSVAACASS